MLYLPHLDIWATIFDFLLPVDLIHFGQISQTARKAVTNYNRLAFDIIRLLSPYFSDEEIKSFRQLQLFTGTVISGSTAVQLFGRTTYPKSDLDIYVEHRYCRDVAWWLTSVGYKYNPTRRGQPISFIEAFKASKTEEGAEEEQSEQSEYALGVENVFDFVRAGSERKVQLISATCCPMEVILNYHSTCVMNVITHNMAYSLFPYATFQQHRALVCGPSGEKRSWAHEKYRERGWEVEPYIDIDEMMSIRSDFIFGRRWVGDGRCWMIPLQPYLSEYAETEGVVRDRITSNSWMIVHPNQANSEMFFISTPPRQEFCLRFRYLCADSIIFDAFSALVKTNGFDDDDLVAQMQIVASKYGRNGR
ncbi:hypothetical protein APHAL10511_003043 [Amanita phalloides]|nr:hypothetical protein APHAL10511_003043 [Amanita phalloides]